MEKQIINNEQEKLNIVILKNNHYGILAKGISKCHPDDEYNAEVGEKIANSRAWIKYYAKLKKLLDAELECAEDLKEVFTKEVENIKESRQNAVDKYNEIVADYNETLKTL